MARTKQSQPRAQPSTTKKRKAPPASTAGTPVRSTRRGNEKVDPEEVAELQKALKEAELKVKLAQKERDIIAVKLKALGQVAIVDPWTQEHLLDIYESRCGDFMETYGEVEDFESETGEDAKLWAIKLLKMNDALEGGYPSDGTGYIDADGQWVAFEATDEDLEEFDWADADPIWS